MKANDQPGQFTGPAEVRIVRTLPGPIERIWEYLTDSEKRSRWFAGGPMELRLGGKVTLHFRHKNLAPDETPPEEHKRHHDPGDSMDGVITRCEPPRVLAFTFGSSGDSEATFELTPQGKNVLLVLTHRARGEDVPYMAEFGAGWHTHFTHLIALLEGAPRPPFWPVHAKLRADYEKLRIAAKLSLIHSLNRHPYITLPMKNDSIKNPSIVSPEKWLAARREFLREEKEFSKLRDRLAARRRELPWVKVDRTYIFDSPKGHVSLAEMFEGRSQLMVYHFMLAPGWEEGCRGCSFVSDHFDGALPHVNARDVSFTAVSSAPLAEIERFKARMGWKFNWVSSHGISFNRDFRVSFTPAEVEAGKADYNFRIDDIGASEMPGLTVFARDAEGAVYRTYSTYSRGLDLLIGAYNLLDLVPQGRNEDPEAPMKWVHLHDQYDHVAVAH